MKHPAPNAGSPGRASARGSQAMTLAEMMVAMAIFSLVVLGMVYVQMFIMKYDQMTTSQLGASEMSRMSFDDLVSDIRSSWTWAIGTGSQTNFTPVANSAPQEGNALQLSQTQNTNLFVRYYFITNVTPTLTNFMLCRMTNGALSYTVIAQNLTNNLYTNMFLAEDYRGNLLTTLRYKYVIHVTLEFCQYQYPLTRVGPGYFYDDYKMEFRVASHNL
jgi:prepilin-type N-terminal cleavage/methylation domain-containing protein